MINLQDEELKQALIPLHMWLHRECNNTLVKIKTIEERVYALIDSNTRICQTQIKLQKKIKVLEKRIKVLESD